jgi:hypothetical protein
MKIAMKELKYIKFNKINRELIQRMKKLIDRKKLRKIQWNKQVLTIIIKKENKEKLYKLLLMI